MESDEEDWGWDNLDAPSEDSDDSIVIENKREDNINRTTVISSSACKVMCLNDVYKEMIFCINQVSQHITIARSAIKTLLVNNKWDADIIINKRFQFDLIEDFLFNECIDIFKALQDAEFTATEGECEVCCCEGTLLALPCGHGFDKECWKQATIQKVKSTGNTNIECQQDKCTMNVPEDLLLTLFDEDSQNEDEKNVIQLIQGQAVQDFVKANKYITKCNGGSCKNTYIKFGLKFDGPARCQCSNRFCCDCGEFYHFPLTCELLKIFRKYDDKETKDELATLNLLLQSTRDCPSCEFTIEKISGCNHITCRKCRHEFCWLCLTPWTQSRGSHNCDITNAKSYKDRIAKQSRLSINAKKYEIALAKYNNHRVGKYYETLINEAVQKMNGNGNLSVFNILPKLYSTQQDARHLAMCSYAFLFFVEDDEEILPFIKLQLTSLESIIDFNSGLMNEISQQVNPNISCDDVANKIAAVTKIMDILEDIIKSHKDAQSFRYCKIVRDYDV
uniref:RBR-type E3 ubiquitin transferase n=1 Tax=Rhabditophanes sp. KR3021 TaxID=114890 RepID=A0AC35UAP7_9BILA